MKTLYFVTTNNYKFEKIIKFFSLESINIKQLKKETPEIQAENNQLVAAGSAKWAADQYNLPVMKEDIGLYIKELNGFPGPYLSQIEKWIGADGFLNLMENFKNRSAYWEYAISFCEPNGSPITFYTHQKGSIAKKSMGKSGWYADKIFIPDGKTKTISELLDEEKYNRNENHYKLLKEYLGKNFV